ncbi:MAG: enoyl-CoA hydratase-related protein [Streptosporangiaceae bacterium]
MPTPDADGELVHLDVDASVATITLDSPTNRNALSTRLVTQLDAALRVTRDDAHTRVVVLTGTGPVFCAGADLKEQRRAEAPAPPLTAILAAIWDHPKPVVARVNGPARAGGIGLIAACDIAVAPEGATFGFSEVRVGVAPAMIAVVCLRRLLPRAALEYFLTGGPFDAAIAAEIGLVNRVVLADGLDAAVDRYVDMLLRGAPEALAETKALAGTVPAISMDEGFRRMAELSAERFASAEAREGFRAFAAKEDPAWVPRDRR